MNKFLKIGAISTACNSATSFGKLIIYKNFDYKEAFNTLKSLDDLKIFGLHTGISFATSTVPALIGYGLGSTTNSALIQQPLSVLPALALTAAAECVTNQIEFKKPALDNCQTWTHRAEINIANLKDVGAIEDVKYEFVDLGNTFIQTELFNIFLGGDTSAAAVEV